MLSSSSLAAGSSGDGGEGVAASIMVAGNIVGDDDKSGGELFESGGGGGGGGNRWPRQETIALLQIRSDMDAVFRDSSLKGPLWEQVSRKMEELGYHRSGKKCKEKFENVYKYHKRTKDGRVGKSEGKTYRFFDQLEALDQHHYSNSSGGAALPLPPPPQPQGPPQAAVPVTMVMPAHGSTTVPSSPQPISVVHVAPTPPPTVVNKPPPPPQQQQQQSVNNSPMPTNQMGQQIQVQVQLQQQQQQQQAVPGHPSPIQMEHSGPSSDTPSSSSSTSSDEELMVGRRKRKRKWKDFFGRMMKEVIDRQEELQKRFLEAVEKREHDRAVREEAWKMQEVTRLNREHEILVKERSMAAAKDAALISFLQKLSEQQHIPLQLPVQLHSQPQPQPQPQQPQAVSVPPVVATTKAGSQPQQVQLQQPLPQAQVHQSPVPVAPPPLPQPQPLTQLPPQQNVVPSQAMVVAHNVDLHKTNNGNGGGEIASPLPPSSSRWPKAEVEALINLRTNLDQKYQENGPKGPLWEEISAAMKKLGYNRNSKRCKEKWENINKYFKKVKESNRKRPEDSKTCPYFHQLDALYRQKNKGDQNTTNSNTNNTNAANVTSSYGHPSSNLNLGQAQQQWPNPGDPEHEDSDEDGDEDEDDDQGTGYEIVANNNNVNANANAGSMSTLSTTATTTTTTA